MRHPDTYRASGRAWKYPYIWFLGTGATRQSIFARQHRTVFPRLTLGERAYIAPNHAREVGRRLRQMQ